MTSALTASEYRRMMDSPPRDSEIFDVSDLLYFLYNLNVHPPAEEIAYRGTRTSSFGMMNAQMNFGDDSKRLQRIAKGGTDPETAEKIVERMRSSCVRNIVSAIEGLAYAEKFLEDGGMR